MSKEKQQNSGPPQIVRLDKAIKLAEQWVNNMTKLAEDDENTETESEGRPARLGLGAKVVRQPKNGHLSDPVERKLHAKLKAGKRKAEKSIEERSGRDNVDNDDEDSDEELESRTSAFVKKRPAPPNSSLQVKKKLK